jgi:hypothetical protein
MRTCDGCGRSEAPDEKVTSRRGKILRLNMGLCDQCWAEADTAACQFASTHHLHLGQDRGLTGAEYRQAIWAQR